MRDAFAAGYAEHGPLPVPGWARAACEAAISTPGATWRLVEAAGRVEGRRAALVRRRQKLYDAHREQVMACAATLAANVHVDDMLRACRAALGETDTDDTRGKVKAAAAGILLRTLRHVDGLTSTWQSANADAYVEATAEGHAEAAASTQDGGPPDPGKVAGLFPAAAVGLATATAWKTGGDWTTRELDGLAGDVALAAKPGLTDAELTSRIATVLNERAGVAFYLEDLMHAGYVAGFSLVATQTGQAVNFQTCDDDRVCPECDSYEGYNPWAPDNAPQPPVHASCRCVLEYAGQVALADIAA